MRLKHAILRFVEMTGFTISRISTKEAMQKPKPTTQAYDQDGLWTVNNHDFMSEPSFRKAYARGCLATSSDYTWHWRVHIGLWAALTASKLAGDFVECGVNRGFLSSAIMDFLDWDSLNRTFYLLDTFEGLDFRYVSEEDFKYGARERNTIMLESGFYVRSVESVKANFSQWKNTRIIQGTIPETLNQVETQNVAFLHLDMNCSPPEIAAIDFFWNRLLPGAIVLLDDYAFIGHKPQKSAMDAFVQAKNISIASLPTGQGLFIKPPEAAPKTTP